ncbi:DNA repair metallo-beta-lactamase-domain-containing protein [Umbelopsis sp. PMI_123]|nr:DNA repair metallo-beta-lactamase-domain-containing protein [Umbelopsis sp. PMI_123]
MKRPKGNQGRPLVQKRLKEKKQKDPNESDHSNGVTLKDFFKNPPAREPDIHSQPEDRFEQDIELAIKLSLNTSTSEPRWESSYLSTPTGLESPESSINGVILNAHPSNDVTAITDCTLTTEQVSRNLDNQDDHEDKENISLLTNIETDIQVSCPICGKSLEQLTNDQSQEHVNSCLDNSNTVIHTPTPEPVSTEESIKESQASSWSRFFGNIHAKISGVWSSQTDQAPGMRGNTSAKQWFGEEKKSNAPPTRGPRTCPFYKKLPGTTLTVDAFSYGKVSDCTGYFLSHFHSDHYTRLSANWRHGPIYCSKVTANLVIQKLGVDPQWVKSLPMDVECKIESSDVTVTLIDANHCPGSVLFLFKVPQPNGRQFLRYLHTGDFRAAPKMCLHPHIVQPANPPIDILYLDTTYLDPRYAFPAQEESVKAACEIVMQRVLKDNSTLTSDPVNPSLESFFSLSKNNGVSDKSFSDKEEVTNEEETSEVSCFDTLDEDEEELIEDFSYDSDFMENVNQVEQNVSRNGSQSLSLSADDLKLTGNDSSPGVTLPHNQTLVVVGTYSIGKEKMFYEIAKLLNSKVFVTSLKRSILLCQENEEIEAILTDNAKEAQVHVIPLMHLKADNLSAYVKSLSPYFTSVLAFRPTGWTFKSSSAQTLDMSSASLEYITSNVPKFTAKSLRPSYSSPTVTIYGIPYSEHSSFRELASFIGSLDIKRIVPTVNVGSERSRQKMGNFFRKWETEKKMKGNIKVVSYRAITHW